MFTGIVEDVGRVDRIEELDGGRRFTFRSSVVAPELEAGASVSVDGACLTVVDPSGETFDVEAIGTTLSRTVAREYRVGRRVNLERALALGDRLEGHLVQGHVDGVGELLEVRREGVHHLLDVRLPSWIWQGTILHGSIALNGISLTVNALEEPDLCQVAIIPHTWERTNLSDIQPGDSLNLEGDLIGKYVGRYLEARAGAPDSPERATGSSDGPAAAESDHGGASAP